MICDWWNWEGMLHWEMLERNATINKELYIAQLHRVKEPIRPKRPNQQSQTILFHDKAGSHIAPPKSSQVALQELQWEIHQQQDDIDKLIEKWEETVNQASATAYFYPGHGTIFKSF